MNDRAASPLRMPATFWQDEHVCAALREHDFQTILQLVAGQLGVTQLRIASACGLTPSRTSLIMTGRQRPNEHQVIQRIASGLDMPDHARAALGLAPLDTQPPPDMTALDELLADKPDALPARAFGKEVYILRTGLGLSQSDLATRAGYSKAAIGHIETGQRTPTPAIAHALDQTLNTAGRLIKLAAIERSRIAMSRRAATQQLRERPNAASGRAASGYKRPIRSEVHDLDTVRSLRTADSRMGGSYLYAGVTSYLKSVVEPRLSDVEFARQGRNSGVLSVAAALTDMAGWMAHDAGGDQVAERHFQEALRLATAGGDAYLSAHVFGSLSHLAYHRSEADRGLAYAHQGELLLGTSGGSVVRARLAAMRARGHAAKGQEAECLSHILKAERALGRAQAEPVSNWLSVFDQASLAAETAKCLRSLRHFAAAQSQVELILQDRPKDRARSRAFALLLLASCHVAQGRLDEACAVANEVLNSTGELGSYLVIQQLQKLDLALASHHSNAAIRLFRERLKDEMVRRSSLASWLPEQGHPSSYGVVA